MLARASGKKKSGGHLEKKKSMRTNNHPFANHPVHEPVSSFMNVDNNTTY